MEACGTSGDWRGSPGQLAGDLIKTPVSFQSLPETVNPYELTTTRTAISLRVGDLTWRLWFRDLPVQIPVSDPITTKTFARANSQSTAAEDINDPNARSRDYNFLTGYEWRLGDSGEPDQASEGQNGRR